MVIGAPIVIMLCRFWNSSTGENLKALMNILAMGYTFLRKMKVKLLTGLNTLEKYRKKIFLLFRPVLNVTAVR